MSAFTQRVQMYQPECDECPWYGDLTPSEDASNAQCDAHDNEKHNPFDRGDDV